MATSDTDSDSRPADSAEAGSTSPDDAPENTQAATGILGRPVRRAVDAVPGLVIGTVRGATSAGEPLVSWEGCSEAREARVVLMQPQPRWDRYPGASVVIGFESGNEQKPIILGLLGAGETDTAEKAQTLKLESEQELILECGKARISLRADGRIMILGGYVLSRSTGVYKIKGGSVQIN